MEEQLFTWKEWDKLETTVFNFHEVELTATIGSHKPGEKFARAYMDFRDGVIQLFASDSDSTAVFTGSLELSVK